ncbi:MAG: hypothetical protein P8X74_12395 [Reinekea sp.]
MLPKNWGEPMGAPTIFEKQIEIKIINQSIIYYPVTIVVNKRQ